MTGAEFLPDYEHAIRWSATGASPEGLRTDLVFIGSGEHALEIALAHSSTRPRADDVRRLWKARQGGRPSPVLVVVTYPDHQVERVTICGPVGESPPVVPALEVSQVERLCAAALREPTRHVAIRFLVAMLDGLQEELIPGLRNRGMLATQELRSGVPQRADWDAACRDGSRLLGLTGRHLVEGLGFSVETLSVNSSVLTDRGAKRVVAVFLDEGEGFEDPGARFSGISPVSHALALADRENLPWVVLTRGHQIRLYAARPDTGVGRRGRAETYVELNLALLPDDSAGYLRLLFGPTALAESGTFEEILEASADHAAELGRRLRERVYFDAVPTLAKAVAARMGGTQALSEEDLQDAYEQTLVILFRLLFIAYAEDKDLLPYRTNSTYQRHAIKTTARELAERHRATGKIQFDPAATDLWEGVRSLWRAVDKGNRDWGVPPYNGGLFSDDFTGQTAGLALAGMTLTNAEIGPALFALLVNQGDDRFYGPVDFRSLSVREFGTIYEGLLESRLSVAPSDLTTDTRGNYIPATGGKAIVEVSQGDAYFHHRSGARKSTGSYFTKPFAVEHLLDNALEPALDDHVGRLTELFDRGDEAAAADAFFDFRCVDLAMGSGHFLVAAVDRIEARLSGFLALHPIAPVTAELEHLRTAALNALGDLAPGVEIEHTSLLRRQVARRCIYGVDLNSIGVELARLAMWIHTFVPGLPLSFLDRNLVEGNSLTGLATLDEALNVLDPAPDRSRGGSLIGEQIREFLERAETALRRMARITEATIAEVGAAREVWDEARTSIEPARQLFDLIAAARIGKIAPPVAISEDAIASHQLLGEAKALAKELKTLHFPVAFPEVFLRERPGFDCILGNPPWEKVKVEDHTFWALHFPGLKAVPAGQKETLISKYERTRPDLKAELDAQIKEAVEYRRALLSGPYLGMGSGDPDLYKAFCWRFWHLTREGGAIGVVLPRSALSAGGSTEWRSEVLYEGQFADVTMLVNNVGWVFEDVHYQYSVGLVSLRKGTAFEQVVRLAGPFHALTTYQTSKRRGPSAVFGVEEFRSWSSGAVFPMLPSARSGEVFLKLRAHPRLDEQGTGWGALPTTEFHAAADKHHLKLEPDDFKDLWPVFKGATFNIWQPDAGGYYAWADPNHALRVLQTKRLRQQTLKRSVFSNFTRHFVSRPETLPCLSPRIAYRQVARATDTRTMIVALVPKEVFLTHAAPYLVWPQGDERDEAYLLGVLSSIPLDWYARRMVEINMDIHFVRAFPIPRPNRGDALRRRVEEIAGKLAAKDQKYAEWAAAVDVPIASVDEDEKPDLLAELDAAVALLYGLHESDVQHIFETFHVGWDYSMRLDQVLEHHRDLRSLAGPS